MRERLTYANVMATLAVFIALGGTSYALTLPRNSVGPAQLRADSVGRSELKRNAVRSSAVKNRSLRVADLTKGARERLRGATGPPGPTLFAAIDSTGSVGKGDALFTGPSGTNGVVVTFPRSVADCAAVATLAMVPGGAIVDPPPGRITVAPTADGKVLVRTWDEAGEAVRLPFNVIVAC